MQGGGTRSAHFASAWPRAPASSRWGLSLDLSGPELSRLAADGGIAHISGDSVVADMAITNKVTRADKVWAGTRGLLGLLSQPAASGRHRVAVIDSGIADPPRSPVAWSHASTSSRANPASRGPVRPRHHIAGIIGGSATAATRVRRRAGGSAPGVHFVDVRVLASNGAGYTSDVIAGIDWTIANARRYGVRTINLSLGPSRNLLPPTRCAAPSPAPFRRVSSWSSRAATMDGRLMVRPSSAASRLGNSPFAITVGIIRSARWIALATAWALRSRMTRPDFAVKPDVVAPFPHRLARESELVAERPLSFMASPEAERTPTPLERMSMSGPS